MEYVYVHSSMSAVSLHYQNIESTSSEVNV